MNVTSRLTILPLIAAMTLVLTSCSAGGKADTDRSPKTDSSSSSEVTPEKDENGDPNDKENAGSDQTGKFVSKVIPDSSGKIPADVTLEELFGQRFYPMDEILKADLFDPIMQIDDVIIPTDGKATVREIIDILSSGSNAINYEYSTIGYIDGKEESDIYHDLMLDSTVPGVSSFRNEGFVEVCIGLYSYISLSYVNPYDEAKKLADCTVTRAFPSGLAAENMFLGGGFRLDMKDLTVDQFIAEYLDGYSDGGTVPGMGSHEVNIDKKYFKSKNALCLFFPTDLTNIQGARLDRTYEFHFDPENESIQYLSNELKPHFWDIAK